jgi:hypothetical protein
MVGGTRGRQNHANPHLGTYSFLSHSLSANIIQYKLIKQIAVQTVSNIHTETENGKTLVHLVVLVPGVFSCSTGTVLDIRKQVARRPARGGGILR